MKQANNSVSNAKLIRDYRKLFRLIEGGTVFCAFDTETTGLSYKTDNVIEIGAVKFDKSGILEQFNSFIKIKHPLPQIITNITHITDKMLEDAPAAKTVLEGFAEFSRGTVLLAHNAAFDWYFVNQELLRNGMAQLKNKMIDTLDLARWAYPLNKKYALQYLAAGMKINVQNAHRAYDDARVCMEVFLRTVQDTMSVQFKAEN